MLWQKIAGAALNWPPKILLVHLDPAAGHKGCGFSVPGSGWPTECPGRSLLGRADVLRPGGCPSSRHLLWLCCAGCIAYC